MPRLVFASVASRLVYMRTPEQVLKNNWWLRSFVTHNLVYHSFCGASYLYFLRLALNTRVDPYYGHKLVVGHDWEECAL